MLITESQMGFNRGIDSLTLLDNMHYLTEAESIFSPAMVPIVENTSVGAHLIRLEDIMTFAESNGIEDLGYALSTVCEASEVDPSTIVFTVNEENVIADESLANLVTGIMNEGVGVIAKPLNENNPMGILTDYAVQSFIESGNDAYIDYLCTSPIALAEVALDADSVNLLKAMTPKQKQEYRDLVKNKQISTVQDFKNWHAITTGTSDRFAYDPKTGKREKDLVAGKGQAEIRGGGNKLEKAEADNFVPDNIAYQPTKPNGGKLTKDEQERKKAEIRQRLGAGANGNANANNPSAAAGSVPSDPKQAESFLDKVKKYANKGRDAIAAVIAKLHKWAAGINYEIQNDPSKKGIWTTIKQKITAAIQYLTAKLHNFVASKNRSNLAAKASDYNSNDYSLD